MKYALETRNDVKLKQRKGTEVVKCLKIMNTHNKSKLLKILKEKIVRQPTQINLTARSYISLSYHTIYSQTDVGKEHTTKQ